MLIGVRNQQLQQKAPCITWQQKTGIETSDLFRNAQPAFMHLWQQYFYPDDSSTLKWYRGEKSSRMNKDGQPLRATGVLESWPGADK